MQGNRLTRFSHHFDTDSTCDQKSISRDLHNYWNDRETLSTNLKMDTNMNTNCMTTIINQGHRIIPMAHKEVYLLSGPSELQPVDDGVTQHTPRGRTRTYSNHQTPRKPNTDPATKTRIQPIHRKRKS